MCKRDTEENWKNNEKLSVTFKKNSGKLPIKVKCM